MPYNMPVYPGALASLFSLLFLMLHTTEDIVRGISKAESSNTALLVLAQQPCPSFT